MGQRANSQARPGGQTPWIPTAAGLMAMVQLREPPMHEAESSPGGAADSTVPASGPAQGLVALVDTKDARVAAVLSS